MPLNSNINDIIDLDTYSLQYSTIADTIKIYHEVGPGALLAKVNLKNTFCLCPVKPEDRRFRMTESQVYGDD